HHPDLTGGDAHAASAATRQMAEINAAYEELRDPVRRRAAVERARAAQRSGASRASAGTAASGAERPDGTDGATARPRPGPPPPRPGRPVTARLDLSQTFTPRNQTTTNGHRPYRVTHMPPMRGEPVPPEPPRASDPTGPLRRGRSRH